MAEINDPVLTNDDDKYAGLHKRLPYYVAILAVLVFLIAGHAAGWF